MRVCKLCQKPGHNKATCGKPPKAVKAPTGSRKCGRCGQVGTGHNKKTCTVDIGNSPDKAESNPENSVWLVSYVRKMVAGKVIQTNRDGVLWEDRLGTVIFSSSDSLNESSYACCAFEPCMVEWNHIGV